MRFDSRKLKRFKFYRSMFCFINIILVFLFRLIIIYLGAVSETAAVAASASSSKSSYVPPGMRAGAERSGTDMRRRNDENSVRVTNLSEDTREDDLHELFRSFGAVTRVYVAIDQRTHMSRGFGFVNFVNKEDAQRAINKLNGYGYDNLILRVEWATPKTN